MDILAYCCASFAESTQKAVGVVPLLSPPLSAFGGAGTNRFPIRALEGHDLIYFKLHGLPGQPYWYGDSHITALTSDQIRAADLSRTIVFVANCHLWSGGGKGKDKRGEGEDRGEHKASRGEGEDRGEHKASPLQQPMLDALLDAGAVAAPPLPPQFGAQHDLYIQWTGENARRVHH